MSGGTQHILQDDYYLADFHTLAGFVIDTYEDLLQVDEIHWYQRVRSLSTQAQRLFVRLLSRKGSTFRLSGLRYSEIEHISESAAELAEMGLATRQAPNEPSLLLACFTRPELIDRLELGECRNLSRSSLLDYLAGCDPETTACHVQRLQQSEQWLTINCHASWTLMQLCFFGNLYQDSSEFVRRQLGALQYESYAITPRSRAFTSRHQIEAHWRYFECEALYEITDLRCVDDLLHLSTMLPDTDENDLTLRRRVDRLRNRIARQLERLSCTEQAIALYTASVHPPARERQLRIMITNGQWQAAAALSDQMQRQPYNEAELITAQRLHVQCQKAQGAQLKRRRVFRPDSSKLVLRHSGNRVEEQARAFFAQKGECFYTENTLVNGVLGLFIWDIIFHPVAGVFYNPFQAAPADFKHPQFIQRRRELLDARFLELNDSTAFSTRVLQSYDSNLGKVNPLVRWHSLTTQLLCVAIERIPLEHWRALFLRILADLRENTTGFPDLVLFPDAGGYEFIEVKGPGDALQANQRRWMHYFDEQGIACRVVHIRYRVEQACTRMAGR